MSKDIEIDWDDIDTRTDQFKERGFMPHDEYLEIKADRDYYAALEAQGASSVSLSDSD